MMSPAQHDPEALAALWTRAQPVVFSYITTLVPDFHQAEEVLQRVAVMLVRKFGEYDTDKPFLPWAIGFARLEVLRHRREYATDRHLFDSEIVERVTGIYQSDAIDFAGWREALRHCVSQLQGKHYEVVSKRYTGGIKPSEIAVQLGMTAGAVRVMLHRVRDGLRNCIEKRINQTGGTA